MSLGVTCGFVSCACMDLFLTHPVPFGIFAGAEKKNLKQSMRACFSHFDFAPKGRVSAADANVKQITIINGNNLIRAERARVRATYLNSCRDTYSCAGEKERIRFNVRSEERRVGKECRCRGAPSQENTRMRRQGLE